jgi:hypothetical protein
MKIKHLAKYQAMCTAIAECHRVDEAKEIRQRAVALAAYAKQANNLELERKVCEIRLRAERRCGELIKELKATGELREGGNGRNQHSEQLSNGATVPERTTLESLGITRTQSSDWQQLAELPLEDFEIALVVCNPRPRTAATILKMYAPKITDPPFRPEDHWRGMPEFFQQDLMPARTLFVHFEKDEDVQKFAELVGQKITPKTKYIYFPAVEVDHVAKLRWVAKNSESSVEVLNAGDERTDVIDTVL